MSNATISPTKPGYFAWGPFVWVAGLHVGALFSLFPAFFAWSAVSVCLFLMWFTGGIGICLTYHRLLTHRSFATRPRWLEYVLTAVGCCAHRGAPSAGSPTIANITLWPIWKKTFTARDVGWPGLTRSGG